MKLILRQSGRVSEFEPDPSLGIITFGRADGSDVPLKGERAASRNHFTLERTVDGWKLVDQMSSNGTLLNGEKVNFAYIKEGDIIQVGVTTIQVMDLESQPAPPPVSPAPPAARPAKSPAGPAAARPGPATKPAGRRAAPVRTSKSPLGGLIAAAVIGGVALVALGWAFTSGAFSSTPDTRIERDENAELQARQAKLDEKEESALARARIIVSDSDDTLKRIRRLDRILDELKDTRAGKAQGDIREMKATLVGQLAEEVSARIENEIASIEGELEVGAYKIAMRRIADLHEYVAGDAYVSNFAREHRDAIAQVETYAKESNEAFIAANFDDMTTMLLRNDFDDAIAVCESLLEHAWLDAENREIYERELENIKAAKAEYLAAGPAVETDTPDQPEVDDPVVEKDEGDEAEPRLPGDNPLLPDGKRSEAEMLAALHGRMVEAAGGGQLTDDVFSFRGKSAKIVDADESRLVLEVLHIDKRSGDELIYRTSVQWEKLDPADLLQLYDRTPGLTDHDGLAIVIFCYENGWTNRGAERAFQLYQSRNDWKEAIDNLIAAKRRIAIPQGGFVEYDGALVTPEEKEHAIFMRELRDVLERFERGLGHRDRRRREEADQAFDQLVGMGERAVKPAIDVLQGILDNEMEKAVRATGLMAADKSRMDALLDELDKRREHALDLIMDTVRYPYPYGPNKDEVQADVNERVAAVREIWNDPAKFTGQTNAAFDATMQKIRDIAQRMAMIDPGQQYYEKTPDETVTYIENIANEELSIKNYTGGNSAKQSLHNYNVEVMKYNEEFPTGEGHTNADGRLQVKITNEYRIMFGRRALKLNDKLFWAAWHHSKYCVEQNGGQIAHEVPGAPRGASPSDRMKYEGYPGSGGENIHMNSNGPTARSAHEAWCQSSGHHRNILNPNWRVLGSGKYQTIWTQNFGALDEGDGNTESKGGA